jgi:glycosyltransferase involved in cell wall biosynthesis
MFSFWLKSSRLKIISDIMCELANLLLIGCHMKALVVIPTFDEVGNIESTIESVARVIGPQGKIIVVDDGSRDGTGPILDRLAAAGRIVLRRHPYNRGIRSTFLNGFDRALQLADDQDAVLLIEADGTSGVEVILDLIGALKSGADVAIASRNLPTGGYLNFPLHRVVLSVTCNRLMSRVLAVEGVSDYTMFFRAYRAGVLRKAISSLRGGPVDFSFNAYFLSAFDPDCKFVEVPFVYDYGEKLSSSKLGIASNTTSYLKLLAARISRIIRVKWNNDATSD